jgi:hypothetical protein
VFGDGRFDNKTQHLCGVVQTMLTSRNPSNGERSIWQNLADSWQHLTAPPARSAHLERFIQLARDAEWTICAPGELKVFDESSGNWFCLGQNWAGPRRGYNVEGRIVTPDDPIQFRPAHIHNEGRLRIDFVSRMSGNFGPLGRRNVDYFVCPSIDSVYTQLCSRYEIQPRRDGWASKVNEILRDWGESKKESSLLRAGASETLSHKISRAGVTVSVEITTRTWVPDPSGPVMFVDIEATQFGPPHSLFLSRGRSNWRYFGSSYDQAELRS